MLLVLLAAAAIFAMGKVPYTDPMDLFDCSLSAGGDKLNVEHAWYTDSSRNDQEWG